MTQQPNVTLNISDGVARLSLTNAAARNALSPQTLGEIAAHLEALRQDATLKVLVLDGAGDAFSVGFDLGAMAALLKEGLLASESDLRDLANLGRHVIEGLNTLPAVTIASVHGWAIGGGFLMMAACDLRVVADDTRFAIPEVDIGLPLIWGGLPLLVHELGPGLARDLVLSGRRFETADLRDSGFLQVVVPAHQRAQTTDALVDAMKRKPRHALRLTKGQFIDAGPHSDVSAMTDADRFVDAVRHPDFLSTAMAYVQRISGGRHEESEQVDSS